MNSPRRELASVKWHDGDTQPIEPVPPLPPLPLGRFVTLVVAPYAVGPDSWLSLPEYAAFRDAYAYAASHFIWAAEAFAMLTPEQVYMITSCITEGHRAVQRRDSSREERQQ